jgi:hypothetical protein
VPHDGRYHTLSTMRAYVRYIGEHPSILIGLLAPCGSVFSTRQYGTACHGRWACATCACHPLHCQFSSSSSSFLVSTSLRSKSLRMLLFPLDPICLLSFDRMTPQVAQQFNTRPGTFLNSICIRADVLSDRSCQLGYQPSSYAFS